MHMFTCSGLPAAWVNAWLAGCRPDGAGSSHSTALDRGGRASGSALIV